IGKQQGFVSSSYTSSRALNELVDRAVAMAKAVTDDPYCGLADPELLAKDFPDLDLFDPDEPSTEALVMRAAATEDAARSVAGITNSEGASASWGRSAIALCTSQGFHGAYSASRHSVAAAVIAGEGTGMERDWEYSSARYAADLDRPDDVGRMAGERTVRRLNPRKVASSQVPIVFEPRVASSLVRHLAGAITGTAVARGTSFLKDQMGQAVFGKGVDIIDDPHRPRGLASKPFDAEGVANRRYTLIDDGVLTTWLLDSSSARQLGLTSTGHAGRGTASPPSPGTTNLFLAAGDQTPADLMGDIADGLYVTELIGFGVNAVTGDYSRGAAGFWVENGELTYPVSELTIAGNLKEMFKALTPANDLEFGRGVDAPTIRIDGMTVAGT
ncbi:MAG: metallopeptidase TldD-related protein, partial [Proteobacteria bacterium]|nr:metallopeptidase TldD-related protein [Pseudomonadota bacterium]